MFDLEHLPEDIQIIIISFLSLFDKKNLSSASHYWNTLVQRTFALYFDYPPKWTAFDLAMNNKEATGFHGGVFDGRYFYFVLLTNHPIMVMYFVLILSSLHKS